MTRFERIPLAMLLAGVMLTSSCADKTAIAYAEDLLAMLDTLVAQASRKLADEENRYLAEAREFESDKAADTTRALEMTRTNASTTTVLNQLLAGKANAAQVLDVLLPEYAAMDFTTTKEIYARRMDAHIETLGRLQSLGVQRAKLKALRTAVEALAVKPSLVEQGGQLAAFARDVKGNLDFHSCEDLSGTISGLAAEIDGVDKKIKAVGSSDALELGRLNDVRTGLLASRKLVEAQRAATGRFLAGKCARP